MRKNVVAFDVDDTLIDVFDQPREHVVNILKLMHWSGIFDVIIWSGGGEEYARFRSRQLGLPQEIPCIAKNRNYHVDIAFDDSQFAKSMCDVFVHVQSETHRCICGNPNNVDCPAHPVTYCARCAEHIHLEDGVWVLDDNGSINCDLSGGANPKPVPHRPYIQ